MNHPNPIQAPCEVTSDWISSVSARRRFRVSGCELMHLREAGAVRSMTAGRSYLYSREDLATKLPPRTKLKNLGSTAEGPVPSDKTAYQY